LTGYHVEAKGAPASAKTNYDSSALAKGHQAGPSAPTVTAAETVSAIPAHVTTGNQDLGSTSSTGSPLLSTDAQMYTKEAEKIVEEERLASEKMPNYPGLSERFQLICKMGDGAFSNVYKARVRKTGQKVAIKVVRKYEMNGNQNDGRLDPQFRKKNRVTERANILKEVQIMRNLKHDGIVKLLEFSESRDHYYLVLELLEGGELFHQIVKLTYFSEPLARHVILQVANGIRHLHEECGIVHRDIKPENLLFESIKIIPSKIDKARPYDEEKEDEGEYMPGIGGGGIGKVKIADFGLSKIVWEESTMTPCGTVGYTAPEIVKDERYSKSVDMWALGCVLYTLLCGFPPFYDESISVLTEKVAKGYYTFLSPWWDDISSSAKDLITHLLCVDTSKRFTIDEFLAHPWCNVKDPVPDLNSADIALAKASEMPLDSPLLQSMKKGNSARQTMMSPGINQLKEAFDVTYAVHRMEEESAHRRGAGGQENLRGVALNEDEEDDEDAEQIQSAARRRGENISPPRSEREYHQQQQQRHQHNPSISSSNSSAQQQQQAAQNYPGRGGADRKMAEAALYDGRAGTRDRGSTARNKKQFELNMGNATLLGRRNRGNHDGISGSIGQMLDHGNSHPTNFIPGSPMRVD
jgi:serine/threonine-protein kinase RCK2